MSLWFANALLILLTLFFLLKSLITKPVKQKEPQQEPYRKLLADRLSEVDREYAVDLIDKREYTQAKHETEASYQIRNDSQARGDITRTPVLAIATTLLFIIAATIFYFSYSDGYRMMLDQRQSTATMEDFTAMMSTFEQHLEDQPQDNETRLLFASSKYLLSDFASAVSEYRQLAESNALNDINDWINYADALLRSDNVSQSEIVLKAFDRTLTSDPDHQRVLFFSGLLRFEREEYLAALKHWQHLLALIPDKTSKIYEELQQLIVKTQNKIGDKTRDAKEKKVISDEVGDAANSEMIEVTVSVAESLRASVDPNDTVFVYARAIGGAPMPLAVVRLTASNLPAEVKLDDDNMMVAGMSLKNFDQVEIVARISKQGRAKSSPGDFIGVISPVSIGQSVAVEIANIIE